MLAAAYNRINTGSRFAELLKFRETVLSTTGGNRLNATRATGHFNCAPRRRAAIALKLSPYTRNIDFSIKNKLVIQERKLANKFFLFESTNITEEQLFQ